MPLKYLRSLIFAMITSSSKKITSRKNSTKTEQLISCKFIIHIVKSVNDNSEDIFSSNGGKQRDVGGTPNTGTSLPPTKVKVDQ